MAATPLRHPHAPPAHHAPANLGQLKNAAAQARKHFDQKLATVDGAGPAIDDLVAGFQTHTPDNFAPANLGQLKAVAKPFYDRLLALGVDTKASLIAHGYPATWAFPYPWNPNDPWNQSTQPGQPVDKTINYTPVNLGQLKLVFSFDANQDTDGDGIPDWWEHLHSSRGLDPHIGTDAGTDAPGGLTYLQKYQLNLDPGVADTDGDGLSDSEELAQGSDPKSAQSLPPFWVSISRDMGVTFHDYAGGSYYWTRTSLTFHPVFDLTSNVSWPSCSSLLATKESFADNTAGTWPGASPASAGGLAQVNPIPGGGGHEYDTYLEHKRVWLKVQAPATVPITRNMLKVTRHTFFGGVPRYREEYAVEAVSVTIAANETTSAPLDLLPSFTSNPSGGTHWEAVNVSLLSVEIEPDANMAGVIGDMVKSAKAGSTIKHFVTPKAATGGVGPPEPINQPYVVLNASGITADQITPGNASQIVEWDGGEAVANEPLKRRVKRDATGTGPTEVKIKLKQGGSVAAQMNVWVVWATCTGPNPKYTPTLTGPDPVPIYGRKADPQNVFKFTILPNSLFTENSERPNLAQKPTIPAPGGAGVDVIGGKPLTGGINTVDTSLWDVSRQIQLTVSNPNSISPNQIQIGEANRAHYLTYRNQATGLFDGILEPFPSESTIGNDDAAYTLDEDSNPYFEKPSGPRAHGIGEITSVDQPTIHGPSRVGAGLADGAKYGERNDFREFARVQIGNKWYRASDFVEWWVELKVKIQNGKWVNDASDYSPH